MPSFEGDVVIPLLVPPCLCPIPEGEGRERRNQREAERVTVSGVIFWPQINEARELSPTLSYPLSKGHSIQGVCKHHGFQTHPKESKKGTLSQSCTHFCCKKKPSQLIVLNNSYHLRGASSVSGTVLPSWELNPPCSVIISSVQSGKLRCQEETSCLLSSTAGKQPSRVPQPSSRAVHYTPRLDCSWVSFTEQGPAHTEWQTTDTCFFKRTHHLQGKGRH